MFNAMQCIARGHEIVALGHLAPYLDSEDVVNPAAIDTGTCKNPISNDRPEELDSYMYQTVGHSVVPLIAKCMDLPLYQQVISGTPRLLTLDYVDPTAGDEVEDLDLLISRVMQDFPNLKGIAVGAIRSDYQRLRVEHIAARFNLKVLSFLWHAEQLNLLHMMLAVKMKIILIKVATMGLNSSFIGKPIDYASAVEDGILEKLVQLKEKWQINVAGEGGEYESLVLDCPLFKEFRIVINEFKTVLHSADSKDAPVYYLVPVSVSLQAKSPETFDWKKLILDNPLSIERLT